MRMAFCFAVLFRRLWKEFDNVSSIMFWLSVDSWRCYLDGAGQCDCISCWACCCRLWGGARYDCFTSRSQISLGGLWRESRFMVSHVTLTYWHRLKHVECIGPSWTLLEQIETQIKPYWTICKILNMLTHIETHWKRFKRFWDIGLWAAHTLFPFPAQSVFIFGGPPAKKCPRISGPVFVRN